MVDRLKELLQKILGWWNKFTARQKTVIVSIVAVVVFAFGVIIYLISRPEYIQLYSCESSVEAAKIVDILNDAGITHRESDDGLIIEVDSDQRALATYAMASSGYVPDTMPKLGDYMDTSMSTTASDREKQYKDYMEAELEYAFESIDAVEKASVMIDLGPQNGTLIAQETEGSAYIQLTLSNPSAFTSANAAAMARATASYLNDDTTSNITILDQNGNILFAGGDDYSSAGIANSIQELKNQAEAMLNSQVKRVILGTGQYDQIQVVARLNVDYSEYERTVHEFYAPEGHDQGMYAEQSTYESESTNGVDGVPGTDSNDSDDLNSYVWPNYSSSESSTSEQNIKFSPNELMEYQNTIAGSIDYDNSSMSLALISYRYYNEDTVRRQGLLDGGVTWEDFKDQNSADVRLDVDEAFYEMAANATGISRDRITIIAYETPVFNDAEGFSIKATDILSIVMIVLILGLLAFVVIRTMRTKKAEEEEEELSVETMLQSTPESELEDIDVETKSETRLLIEKFVDENPEAAANLLRNWLNEDWN